MTPNTIEEGKLNKYKVDITFDMCFKCPTPHAVTLVGLLVDINTHDPILLDGNQCSATVDLNKHSYSECELELFDYFEQLIEEKL